MKLIMPAVAVIAIVLFYTVFKEPPATAQTSHVLGPYRVGRFSKAPEAQDWLNVQFRAGQEIVGINTAGTFGSGYIYYTMRTAKRSGK